MSDHQFRMLVDSSPEAIFIQTHGRFAYVNKACVELYGAKSSEELIGTPVLDRCHPDMHAIIRERIRLLNEKRQETSVIEQKQFTLDGRLIHVEVSAVPFRFDGYDGALVFTRNITERKQAEDELRKYREQLESLVEERTLRLEQEVEAHKEARSALQAGEAKYRQLFENAGDPVFIADTVTGMIVDANLQAQELSGYSLETLRSMHHTRLHPPESAQQAQSDFNHAVAKVKTRMEQVLITSSGRRIPVEINATGIFETEEGKFIIGIFRDITELKKVEETTVRAMREAQAASMAKTRFVANMSHELRTPMNAILGFADILQRDATLTPEQARKARLIHTNGRNLLRLINEILDMSKIEAGQVSLKQEDFHLPGLLVEAANLFRPMAQARGLDFVLETHETLPAAIHADQVKLRQIMINLLGNAVKFTRSGRVTLRGRGTGPPQAPSARGLGVVIEVEDTGPGIAGEDLPYIFNPFHQAAVGIEAGGTGLGLPISREYARLMGGDLTATSREGHGSCFRLEITVQPAVNEVGSKEVPRRVVGIEPGTGPWRILIVDDRPDNLTLLSELLLPVGFEVREAVNGAEALKVFKDWRPHAVLMDMRMPVMDGYESTRRIRATEAGRETLIVALTAWAFKDAREKAGEAGVNAHLTKPFKAEDLFDMLSQRLGLRYIHGDAPSPAFPEPVPGMLPSSPPDFPPALTRDILKAVLEGDISSMRKLATQAEHHDRQAAGTLRTLVENFDYSGIEAWLEMK